MEILNSERLYAEVNGKSQNRCIRIAENSTESWEKPSKETALLGSQFISIGVFSDDFATVDVREGLCYHSRPKKQKSEG